MAMHAVTQMDQTTRHGHRGGGLRPGQKHSGSFKPGHDPRRLQGVKLYDGKTLSQIARTHTPECVALMATCVSDDNQKMADRLRAAELLLDRGWGKSVSIIDMQVSHREVSSLTLEELEALARGEPPRVAITVEGEIVDVEPADCEPHAEASITAPHTALVAPGDTTC